MTRTLYVIDGMALVYRAHFAFARNPILTTAGLNTSALFGFTNTLLEILEIRKPTHIAVAFDTSAPTSRHEIFPAYKGQRDEMPEDLAAALPAVVELLQGFRIPLLQMDGFEADDIVGTIATRVDTAVAAGEDWTLHMVTPDKDFGQLVSERCFMMKPGKAGMQAEIMGPKEVSARWGIESPAQVIDVLALMGDVSDNIPGISGIGEKTAAKLIRDYGSMEQVMEAAGGIKGKLGERLREGAEAARLSKILATIIRDVPIIESLDDLIRRELDRDVLMGIFAKYEFNSIGKRVFGNDFAAGRTALKRAQWEGEISVTESQQEVGEATAVRTMGNTPHHYITTTGRENIVAFLSTLHTEERVCFDTETTGLDPLTARLLGFSFCVKEGEAHWCPVAWNADEHEYGASLEAFRLFFAQYKGELQGHNLKFDLSILLAHGFEFAATFFDTMLVHALMQPEQRHGMDFLAETYLAYRPVKLSEIAGVNEGRDLPMKEIAEGKAEALAEYAAEDADVTWRLARVFRPLLEEARLSLVYERIEAPLILVLARMELAGVALDTGALAVLSVELAAEIEKRQRAIVLTADFDFNLNSPKQLGEVLFNRLKLLQKPKKTKTGQYVTDEATLESIRHLHPIIEDILLYRELSKLKSTYVDALPAAVHSKTGRVHTTYHQVLTSTGRLASSDPNLQNIPVRSERGREIRAAFYSGSSELLIFSADYSQIELRLMASMSDDAQMKRAFEEGEDIHAATAARLYRVSLDEVNADMRRAAKTVNFGIIYGISSFGLAQRLGIPRSEGAALIDMYFRLYPGVKRYMGEIVAKARQTGYVETMMGRRRMMRDINDGNAVVRGRAERMAINAPLQGSAADMIKLAMSRIDGDLQASGCKTRMLLQVHDELIFEMPQAEKDEVAPRIVAHMVEAMPLKVPVVVDSGFGVNWLQAH